MMIVPLRKEEALSLNGLGKIFVDRNREGWGDVCIFILETLGRNEMNEFLEIRETLRKIGIQVDEVKCAYTRRGFQNVETRFIW